MPYSLSEILTPEERDEVLETLLAVAAALQAPTTSWVEGDPILTMMTTASQKLADLTVVATEIGKGGFGDLLPSDAWADLWAQSRFKVQRVQATQARTTINLLNATATPYVLAAKQLIVAHAATGKLYRNSDPITILASTTTPDVAIEADEPGTASNAAPGAITVMVSSQVGVTIPGGNTVAALGTDKESTLALVTRARSKLGALSPNGPKDAYNFIAITPEFSATSIPITRTRTVVDPATGFVSVYLATAAGPPSGGDVAIVQAAIDAFVEPWGTTATAYAATAVVQPITYQGWVKGSQLTDAQIKTAIANALAAWFATLDIGGYVIPPDTGAIYRGALEQVIGTATPGMLKVAITVPATDLVMTPLQVAQLGTITPTITLL